MAVQMKGKLPTELIARDPSALSKEQRKALSLLRTALPLDNP